MTVEPRPNLHWRATHLLIAPHRLGFFLALVVLVASGAWWAVVQLDRVTGAIGLSFALSPSLVHGAVMTFGFIPLFFSGFLFTAGPKWLRVQGLAASQLSLPLGLQAIGWLLWVVGSHWRQAVSLFGLAMALSGLFWVTLLFWSLIRRSKEDDQLHARTVGVACVVGCLSIAGLLASVLAGGDALALACILTGLWGFVVVVYVTVAHRMIPFFTSSAMPFISARRPFWALGLMLSVAGLEVLAVWVELLGPTLERGMEMWFLLRGALEVIAGGVLLWLAVIWGLMQSLKNKLLAMLHIGFVWLGLALVLGAVAQFFRWQTGAPVLALGQLHALTMGCLASLMLAMVTRVACGHSGRALVADATVWTFFLALQCAVILRISAALPTTFGHWLVLGAALLWLAIMAVWGFRLMGWFGRLRADGGAV
jgi:uncharacterized protein involved in response to NO